MYNRAIAMGRLTADPELKQTPNGVSVTSFSIAVDRKFTNKETGERTTDFLDIVAWRGTAEFICRYFSKGRPILIEGSIQTRTYTDKQGNSRRVWEIVADQASFTESKANASGGDGAPAPVPSRKQQPAQNSGSQYREPPVAYSSGSVADFAELDDDGDLPF